MSSLTDTVSRAPKAKPRLRRSALQGAVVQRRQNEGPPERRSIGAVAPTDELRRRRPRLCRGTDADLLTGGSSANDMRL